MTDNYMPGRHFLQIPGPSNVPDSVLHAMAQPVIDHRGPEFPELTFGILEKLRLIFNTEGPIFIYPSSGTGGWECALLNVLSPGDKVLAFETGHFATLWKNVAERLGLHIVWIAGDWRHGINPSLVEEKLSEDSKHEIKAVLAVQTETSTGVTSQIPRIRAAIDAVKHPALFLVDTVSSLACTEFRHDDWGVDVTVSGSQKGLMLPPGLSFNAVSEQALACAQNSTAHHSYWRWDAILENNQHGYFPYTPNTNLLYGLDEALTLLHREGMDNVLARHARLAEATRRAVAAWGLENLCMNPEEYCNSLTAVLVPEGYDADALRKIILERFNMSLGTGLGRLKGAIFRIGHLGDFNDLMLAGTLGGIEMGLALADIPHSSGGVDAALEFLAAN
ncbi:MAG TPA: serine--glyoxylate aminotransferase [Gammaproteobacteria bacterium]|jgi:alanine-glyoxylate transaminase/serine-glyoxylate transaminase/serine-pyruvate transaminase|nr:aminotransferase class V-fold PLP-dependent enzyme [Gammaproteobacteria bacterium]MDP6733612.1 aminotransferase class V-fold PLP-dependent enzyme [Gammaproteobacteria bacterium]HAJ77154.1 serine--glyoxylate aminotransferase [Gammaproteobacteria bacterium]